MWSQVQQTTPDQTQLRCWLWSEVQEISHPIENQCSKSYCLIINWSDLSLLSHVVSGSDRGGCRSDVHSNRKTQATFPLKSSTLINFKLQILSDWEQLFWGRTSIFRPDGSKELCPIFDLSSQLCVGRKLQGHCFNWEPKRCDSTLCDSTQPILAEETVWGTLTPTFWWSRPLRVSWRCHSEMCWRHSDSPAPLRVSLVSSETDSACCWTEKRPGIYRPLVLQCVNV